MSLQREASKSPKRRESFLVFFPLLTTTTALPGGGRKKAESAEIVLFLGLFGLKKRDPCFFKEKIQEDTAGNPCIWYVLDKSG